MHIQGSGLACHFTRTKQHFMNLQLSGLMNLFFHLPLVSVFRDAFLLTTDRYNSNNIIDNRYNSITPFFDC